MASTRERVDRGAEIGAFTEAERCRAAFARAEGPKVDEQDREPSVERVRDRQHVRLVRRVPVEGDDDGRLRGRGRNQPGRELHVIRRREREIVRDEPVIARCSRDREARGPHDHPERPQADGEYGSTRERHPDERLHAADIARVES